MSSAKAAWAEAKLDLRGGQPQVPWCENVELVIPSQESRGRTSTWTARMASFTGCKNQARDFARAAKLPLEPSRTIVSFFHHCRIAC